MKQLLLLALTAYFITGACAMPVLAHNTTHLKSYPTTIICKHCKIKITIKSPADLKKACPVCPCGTPAEQCQSNKK